MYYRMGIGLIVLVALTTSVLCCCLLTDCPASGAKAGISYPPGWPDASITVPPDSSRAKFRVASSVGDQTDGYVVTGSSVPDMDAFGVGFRNSRLYSEITEYFDDLLLPKGYAFDDENSTMRTYIQGNTYLNLYRDPKDGTSYMLAFLVFSD